MKRFFNTIFFFLFFFVLVLAAGIAALYFNRDSILLQYLRQYAAQHARFEKFSVTAIETHPLGQVSVELRGFEIRSSPNAPLIEAETIILSTPKNILELYLGFLGRDPLELKMQLMGFNLHATTREKGSTESAAVSLSEVSPIGLPFPINLTTEFRNSQLTLGPAEKPLRIQKLTGLVHTQIGDDPVAKKLDVQSSGQFSLSLGVGDGHLLPMRTDWKFTAHPLLSDLTNFALNVDKLTISMLGLNLKSAGSLKWPEQNLALELSGSTPDLSVLPLDAAESEALGLSGRLGGSADVSMKLSGVLNGIIDISGLVRVKNGRFPFAIKRETPRPVQVTGPVQIEIEAPFKVGYDVPSSRIKSLALEMAAFKFDLTPTEVRVRDILAKAAGIPFSMSGQAIAAGETMELHHLDFRLANFTADVKGDISLDPKRNSKLDLTMSLPSFEGWPLLLPILGNIEGDGVTRASDLNRARGSFFSKAKIELPLGRPEAIRHELRAHIDAFDASGVEFPMNIKSEAGRREVRGLLRTNLSLSGNIEMNPTETDPMTWDLDHVRGSADLKDLAFVWDELVTKKQGSPVALAFAFSAPAAGEGSKSLPLKIQKFEIRALDSTAEASGPVTRLASGDIELGLATKGRVALSQIYELVPALRTLRAKVPSGTVTFDTKIDGTFKKDGIENSPLILNGRVGLKTPRLVVLDPTAAATKSEPEQKEVAPPPEPTFHRWPLVGKSKLVFETQIDTVTLKSSALKSFAAIATLTNGSISGSASIGQAFGGTVKLSSFAIPELSGKSFSELAVQATGNFQNVDLALLGEFANPQWKTLVAGLATGTFQFRGRPMAKESLLETANAAGELSVKHGHLSTVSLDQMVNQKLAELPALSKLTGARKPIATKGISLNATTGFTLADGRIGLKSFKAISPEKNELQLEGWLKSDFSTDLQGLAFLADAPIGGSFRQANSDKQGRLIVPVRFTGSLTSPSLTIASEAIEEMTKKTVALETDKIKKTVQDQAGRLLNQKKKEAVDAVKEELKKRGLGF